MANKKNVVEQTTSFSNAFDNILLSCHLSLPTRIIAHGTCLLDRD